MRADRINIYNSKKNINNIFFYIFLYSYIYRRANGIYILYIYNISQKGAICNLWTVCLCYHKGLLLYILSALYSQHILTPLGFYISYKTHTFLCLIKPFKIRKERGKSV